MPVKRILACGLIASLIALGRGAWTVQAEDDAFFDGSTGAVSENLLQLAAASEVPAVPRAVPAPAPAKHGKKSPTVVLIQIDGLGYRQLLRAIQKGEAPRLAALIQQQGYRVSPYLNGIPTVTMAVLTEIFYGKLIPGNEWYSKAQDKPQVANVYERTFPASSGLLYGGDVHLSELSGGGTGTNVNRAFLERSDNEGKVDAVIRQVHGAYPLLLRYQLSHRVFPGRISAEVLGDKLKMGKDFKKAGIDTDLDKKAPLFLALIERVFSPVALEGVKRAVRKRAPIVFADFSSWDERAHYYGAEAPEVSEVMTRIDQRIGEIARTVAEHGARLVIFSDHGQTKTENFIRKFGKRPQQALDELALASNPKAPKGELVFSHVYSMGNIYVRGTSGHLEEAELERRYPGLIARLVGHPGIGMVAVRNGAGIRLLGNTPDPLVQYADAWSTPAVLRSQVENYMGIDESGDIVVFAPYDGEKTLDYNENYTIVSEHGGLGGDQMHPFILYDPSAVTLDPAAVQDARGLHGAFQALR